MHDLKAGRPKRWLWIAAIWLGVGLFDATQTVFVMRSEGMHHAWTRLFFSLLLSWLVWGIATPLVVHLGRRYPLAQVRSPLPWLVHLAAYAGIGLVWSGWVALLERWWNPWAMAPSRQTFGEFWFDKFYNDLLASLILYMILLLVSHMLDSRDRLAWQQTETARLSAQLSTAQLNALRRQIEPHFLFNALNAIAGLVRENRNDEAVRMIAALSDFMRRTLQDSTQQQVALAEEMEFLQQYLDIEKVRFGDRLQIKVDVPAELLPAKVPSLILQPMAENAVKHGISKRAQGGAIRIAASRSNGMLLLSVSNDGPNLPGDWNMLQPGVGLSNIRTRLQGLYGDRCELHIGNQEQGGVQVSVSVPFEER